MNDNEPTGVHARMMAEQAVARMDSRLRWRMDHDAREGLVEAIIKTGSPDQFLFRPEPFRVAPSRWSLSGFIARVVLKSQRWRASDKNDATDARSEALDKIYYKVRRSGAVGLIVTLFVALLIGVSDIGRPLEIALQIGRDAVQRTAASGDIVVIAKDDRSAKLFGGLPWKRRYDAQLLDRLRQMGATRIVFNQVMADPSNPVDDKLLADAFERAGGAGGDVWLSAMLAKNAGTGKLEPVLPIPLFRDKTKQNHMWVNYGLFGNIETHFGSIMIDNRLHHGQAAVIAGKETEKSSFRSNYAIDYKSIPTISAVDIMSGKIGGSELSGKTVVISEVSDTSSNIIPILGQGRVSGVYSTVIAAETIKAGIARELGYIVPLLVSILIGIACIISEQRKRRAAILIGGAIALLLLLSIGDRVRLHFEMVPALLALLVIGIRESTRSKIITAMTTDELTGLPNLSHLKYVKGYQKSAVVGVKIKRYEQFIGKRSREDQQILLRAIVARINVIAQGCLVHQSDKGLFIFLVPPGSPINLDVMPGQLYALFTQDFIVPNGSQRVDISVGVNDDMDIPFDVRLAVAKDRTLLTEFVTLQAVN
jgi:diguanylate cyclase